MKEYSNIQKIISAIMIFILLLYLSGCTTTKIISKSDLHTSNLKKYAYIVHCETLKFLLEDPVISNDTLSGKVKQVYTDISYDAGNKINVYLSSDSIVKIDKKGEHLSVPMAEVTRLEMNEVHGLLLPFILLGLGVGIAFLWTIIDAADTIISQ